MDITTVSALFTLFSGEQDTETYVPVLTAAIDEVAQELRPDASAEDARLNYLAAAVADLRYTQICGARERALATFAGTLRRVSDHEQQTHFARQLVYSYKKLCADLLKDPEFAFFGCRG
jgi:hypothetical protein